MVELASVGVASNFTIFHGNSRGKMCLEALEALQERGIVRCTRDAADRSSWVLTSDGLQSLR
eukprot:11373466-Alexandrium_andersonii.AAC.1